MISERILRKGVFKKLTWMLTTLCISEVIQKILCDPPLGITSLLTWELVPRLFSRQVWSWENKREANGETQTKPNPTNSLQAGVKAVQSSFRTSARLLEGIVHLLFLCALSLKLQYLSLALKKSLGIFLIARLEKSAKSGHLQPMRSSLYAAPESWLFLPQNISGASLY